MQPCHRIATRLARQCTQRQLVNSRCLQKRCIASGTRQWSTPLAKSLAEAITTTGPIPVAAYMRQCLTSPNGGYYTTREKEGEDQFGQKGDFITSPEISQVFGELVGIWFVAEWMAQGKKSSGVQFIEVGPGRGTLMDDLLRTIRNFKPLASSIESIYLVEASPLLREAQRKLLCGDAPIEETQLGHESVCKHLPGVKVIWCEDIKFVPKDASTTPFIIAHEFFDALPIHIFKSVAQTSSSPTITTSANPSAPVGRTQSNQWRELVVSPAADADPLAHDLAKQLPEFELTVSQAPTAHSLYLPEMSSRYKALKSTTDAIIEISPESQLTASDMAIRIGGSDPAASTPTPSSPKRRQSSKSPHEPFIRERPSGAALILDYGTTNTIPANSLRGIRSHKIVSPMSSPGVVDLSADVDFLSLAHAALDASPSVAVHGPVEQSFWLGAMGIQARAEQLASKSKNEEEKNRIKQACERLVDRSPQGMGKIYKAMAIVPYLGGEEMERRPVGFGGDIRL